MTQLSDWMEKKEKSVDLHPDLEEWNDSAQETFLEIEELLKTSEQLSSAYAQVMENKLEFHEQH